MEHNAAVQYTQHGGHGSTVQRDGARQSGGATQNCVMQDSAEEQGCAEAGRADEGRYAELCQTVECRGAGQSGGEAGLCRQGSGEGSAGSKQGRAG